MPDFGGFIKAPTLLDAVDALTLKSKSVLPEVVHQHDWQPLREKDRWVKDSREKSGFRRIAGAPVPDLFVCAQCDALHGDGSKPKTWDARKKSDAPLLDQLREAVANNIGGNGGGKQARERTPLDVGAFQLYETIDGRLRSWLGELGAKPGKDVTAAGMLRTWHRLWIGGVRNEANDNRYQTILEGWETQIRDRLDPPKRIEIQSPCPACNQEYVNVGLKLADGSDDPNDVERVRVLNAVERENINESFALCSNCEKVWKGVPEMRALRIAIDDAEELKRKATA